jgi:hypothetical protein
VFLLLHIYFFHVTTVVFNLIGIKPEIKSAGLESKNVSLRLYFGLDVHAPVFKGQDEVENNAAPVFRHLSISFMIPSCILNGKRLCLIIQRNSGYRKTATRAVCC